ncbi:MAG TPA: alpha/beta hydrolase [Rhizomicrobium sp.]|jgi:monoterpene epsilon-lactone hydrolase|nr:alpha/beta hydrolase [Rhizomicrobium sp.]
MALFARARGPQFDAHTSLGELRGFYTALFSRFGAPDPDVAFKPAKLGLINGEWVHPANAVPERLILYFHGGGFIAGSPETHRTIIAKLAKEAEASALSVAYRLAPECPFPSAVRDGVDVYRHLIARDVSPGSIVLAGDGAGGGLAFATCVGIRNGGLPMPAGIVAMSPWADLSLSGWSMMENSGRDAFLGWDALFLSARQYLKRMNPNDPYASPAFANFKDFPPIMVHAGQREILRDDASRIGDRAAESNVPVSIEIYDGMQHLFQADPMLREAGLSLGRLGNFIRARTKVQQIPQLRSMAGE